jgi:hypothetical protein
MKKERNRDVPDDASLKQPCTSTATASICPRCGSSFECGTQTGAERCWCAELPLIEPVSEELACFCPACLREIIAERESEGVE